MSIGSQEAGSQGTQVDPGAAAAGSKPSASSPSSSDPAPRTPTPPPKSAQQAVQTAPSQQQSQQQPQHSSPSQSISQNVATQPSSSAPAQAKVASSSAPAPASQPPPRPPPPASAVSLHDAAAKAAAAAANKAAAGGSALTDPESKQTATPAKTQSTSSQSGLDNKGEANGSTKKTAKPKAPKPPGQTKPKQKRRANQASTQDELVYRPTSSTVGGTIGAAPDLVIPAMLSAAGGGRKALPELVLPFQLPYVDVRPDFPVLDNASVQSAMAMGASETSSPDTGSDSDDYSVLSDESDLDSETEESRRQARRRRKEPATIEESLVLLQSLRQSRLSHLSSLLTPFSQRVKSGMIYPNVLPLSLLHGLNPREPHVLIQLGRADIHVGPHVFMKTKFWEVRPDYEMPPIMDPLARMRAHGSFGGPPDYVRLSASQPLPHHMSQPPPPLLPSPRAAPVILAPSVPLAGPPTSSAKPLPTRPPQTSGPSPAPSTASTSVAAPPTSSVQAVTKPIAPAAPVVTSTPTLPATPVASSASARSSLPSKPPVSTSPSASASSGTTTAPAASPALASTLPAKPTAPGPSTTSVAPAASAGTSTAASSTPASPAIAAKPTVPSVASKAVPSTSNAGAATSAAAETKPASVTPAAVAATPKPIALPVSLPRPPMTTPSLPRPPSINQAHMASNALASSTAASGAATLAAAPTASSQAPAVTGTQAKPASAITPVLPRAADNTASSSAGPATSATAAAPAASTSTTPAAPSATSTAAPSSQAAAAGKPADAPTATTSTQPPPRPAGVPPPPAIDAVLVSRVNATAALNPELQELLHIAASGKANPNQLKALGVWIQAITAQLRQDEARNAAAANKAGAAGSSASNGASAANAAAGKKTKKTKVDEAAKASKKQAKIEEREAKKQAKAEAKAKAQADKQMAQKQQKEKQPKQPKQQQQQQSTVPPVSNKLRHPPPGWPTDGPPKPPVIIVEFRENPSMRFILPLWKCLVERTEGIERPSIPKVKKERRSFFDNDSEDEESQRIEPELKLSFFAPSLGSDAADGSGLRELEEELKRKAAEEARLNPSKTTPPASQAANSTASPEAQAPAEDKNGETTSAASGKKKKGSASTGGKKSSSKAIKQEASDMNGMTDLNLSKKHEVYPLTWSIKGGVTESLWEAFGRVPGTMTCQPVKREPEIELEPDVAEFLVPEIRYHLLDLPMEEIKFQKETTDSFVDLYSQMPDRRFILPRVAPALLPQGLEEHLQDRFAVRPQCVSGRPMVKRKAGAREDDVSFSYEGIGLTVIGPNGIQTEAGATPAKPPKRKRHVATHNPDGSIKSCGACGKTKTPMWRRGPKGPSQLCNACGARWKAGRLVVPEVAPPPIIESEESKSKDEEARKEDEVQASMHGSNALVIPQSSSGEDGSFTVMAASGLVGPAAFGDHSGAGMYSLGSDSKTGMGFGSSHLARGSASPSPFIRSPVPEDEVMPASVDPSMLSGSMRLPSNRR
ncbi:hypothetical protein L1887_58420 [Cichorium endivia]|nr:hypothetical protein L1887_58420 [Cichorium endivia]